MYGFQFLNELCKNLTRCDVEEFISFCQLHPGIRPYAVITNVAPESVIREISADEYWAYLARRAWLFKLHSKNGESCTVSWEDFLAIVPSSEASTLSALTTDTFWPIAELFVWLFHGPAYGGFTVVPGKEVASLDDVLIPVSPKGSAPRLGGLDWYYRAIEQYPLLPRETEVRLARLARMGDQYTRNALILANLRFATWVARRYRNCNVPIEDLIQAANIGLCKAADRFDPDRGFKFISYAVWWIRQSILQAIQENRVVHLPVNRISNIHRLRKAADRLSQELGREATAEDIANALGISQHDIETDRLHEQNAASLDAPLDSSDDGTASLFDLIWDLKAARPARDLLGSGAREEINRALSTLDDRQAEVLDKYYGINYDVPMTLEEIGEHYGLTRERIRQVKEEALIRLRHHTRAKTLFAYFLKLEGKR
jgi:RNA polymerase primary sigma factor